MTNDELIALVSLNGDDATYDARLSGYDITVPVRIEGGDGTTSSSISSSPCIFQAR